MTDPQHIRYRIARVLNMSPQELTLVDTMSATTLVERLLEYTKQLEAEREKKKIS